MEQKGYKKSWKKGDKKPVAYKPKRGPLSKLMTEEEKSKVKLRSYEEVFTPEEAKRMGIGGHIDGPGDWKPDPNAARNIREFLQKGGNADPAIDALQNSDFYDVIDQLGGEEGF